MEYRNSETTNMIITYGECYKNTVQVNISYVKTYSDQKHSRYRIFENCFKKRQVRGSFESHKRIGTKPVNSRHCSLNVL